MTILLIIYLSGFAGTGIFCASNCTDKSTRMTTGECITSSVVMGAAWPVIFGYIAYENITEIK